MDKLGIDPVLLGVQIINFIILFVILKKVLYKPILQALKTREEKLSSIDAQVRDLASKQESLESNQAKVIKQAKADASKIVSDAGLEAQRIKKEAVEEGNAKAKALIAKGHAELQRQEKLMDKEVDERSRKLSQQVLARVLGRVMDESARAKSVAQAAKELKS